MCIVIVLLKVTIIQVKNKALVVNTIKDLQNNNSPYFYRKIIINDSLMNLREMCIMLVTVQYNFFVHVAL